MPDSNDSYLKLITSEYATQPNFNSYVETFLNYIVPVNNCYELFDTIFKITTAEGDQLDKLGSLLNVSRVLPVNDADITPVLNDTYYRKVLLSTIYKIHYDGTRQGLVDIMVALFPGLAYDIVDNQDMSYSITIIDPTIADIDRALLFNGFILPKPAGIKVNYSILNTPLFGWDMDSAFIKGWDEGTWATN